jgi:tetratricopeptide (TPR) repeat protein
MWQHASFPPDYDWAGAERIGNRFIKIYEQLAAANPGLPGFQSDLAIIYARTGDLLTGDQKRRRDAIESYQKSIALWECLIRAYPKEPAYQAGFLDLVGNMSYVLSLLPGTTEQSRKLNKRTLELSEELMASHPEVPQHRVFLASALGAMAYDLASRGNYREAEKLYCRGREIREKLAADYPNVQLYRAELADLRTALGFYYNRLQNWDKAIAEFDKVIELQPKDAGARTNRAFCYANLRQWDKARADYDKAVELEPKSAQWRNERGAYYANLKLCDKARADYDKADELLGPKAAGGCNGLAWVMVANPNHTICDPDRAVYLAKKAVELAPEAAGFWNTLGVAHYRAGAWQAALAALEESMELDGGGNAFDWFFLSMSYEKLGDKEKARQWYVPAVLWMEHNSSAVLWMEHKFSRENARLVAFRAEATGLLGLPDQPAPAAGEAQADYLRLLLEGVPRAVFGFEQQGSLYRRQHQWDKAIPEYDKAIDRNPKDAFAWHNRAHAYAVLAQWDKAAADSAKAVELQPEKAEWWLKLASYELLAGHTPAYRTACERMLERFGQTKNPIIARRIALRCVLSPQAVKDEQLVLQLAEQSVAKTPNDQLSVITLGAALYRAGQFEAAVHHCGPIAETRNPLAWLVLAMAHHRLGHTEEARRWLDKAVQTMDKETAAKEIGPLRQQSEFWANCLALRCEAEELLRNKRPGENETAR